MRVEDHLEKCGSVGPTVKGRAVTHAIIESVEQFLHQEFANTLESNHVIAFRGHDEPAVELQATVYRSNNLQQNEDKLLSELIMQSPDEFVEDNLAFEQLVRARHYGLPTRILDVTLNPLVALFFSTIPKFYDNGKEIENDAELIRFSISQGRVKMFDSDTVSIICNMSKLRYGEKSKLLKMYQDLRSRHKGSSGLAAEKIEEIRSMSEIHRLIQFVRIEKPYFLNEVNPPNLWRFILVHPKKSNKRIVAQSGAFIASGLIKKLRDDASKAFQIERFLIPFRCRKTIRGHLSRLNINASTMFPDLEPTAIYIKEKYSQR